MQILVAGAAGFIGSHLCDYLINEGHNVTGVDNLITGRMRNIEHLLGQPQFTFINHDIIQADLNVTPPDRVYNLASPASPVGYMSHPFETHLVNSIGTLNLLTLAREHKARFLFTSTSEAYGDPAIHPQPETYYGNVNSVGPRSCYDESKRFGESITMEFVRQYGFDARIVRIFNTYGPRNDPDDGRMIPNFINRALANEPITVFGTGEQTRSLCYVTDLVEGLVSVMESNEASGEVINLGNPDERTVIKIARTIIDRCGSSSSINYEDARPDDPVRRCPDISKARRLLKWEPHTGIDEGLLKTVDYFKTYDAN